MKLYRTDRPALDAGHRRHARRRQRARRARSRAGHDLRFPAKATLLPRAATVAETIGTDVAKIAKTSPLTIRAASGRTFYISRRYRSPQQAEAFQFMLDRLSALSLIDWGRRFDVVAVPGALRRSAPATRSRAWLRRPRGRTLHVRLDPRTALGPTQRAALRASEPRCTPPHRLAAHGVERARAGAARLR